MSSITYDNTAVCINPNGTYISLATLAKNAHVSQDKVLTALAAIDMSYIADDISKRAELLLQEELKDILPFDGKE